MPPPSSVDQIEVLLPSEVGDLDQDEEYCVVEIDGEPQRIRFHDYAQIFTVPGLYERIFYDLLDCVSPSVVSELLMEELEKAGQRPQDLDVLDFGAGNGMVGERLADAGASTVVGIDLLEEAREAALRDRPGVYDAYHALDLTDPVAIDESGLSKTPLNCLACVAALGFSDVPPAAFVNAFELIDSPGWIAFNLNERFVDGSDESGFSRLLEGLVEEGALVTRAKRRYRHRYSVNGEPLYYVAVVAEKRGDVPPELLC